MAYDPQSRRRRPKPADDEPSPVEAILDADPWPPSTSGSTAETASAPGPSRRSVATTPDHGDGPAAPLEADELATVPVADDPPPDPSVTPHPADPWSDQLLFGVSISTIVGALVTALVFRWLWMRSRRSGSAGEGE